MVSRIHGLGIFAHSCSVITCCRCCCYCCFVSHQRNFAPPPPACVRSLKSSRSDLTPTDHVAGGELVPPTLSNISPGILSQTQPMSKRERFLNSPKKVAWKGVMLGDIRVIFLLVYHPLWLLSFYRLVPPNPKNSERRGSAMLVSMSNSPVASVLYLIQCSLKDAVQCNSWDRKELLKCHATSRIFLP